MSEFSSVVSEYGPRLMKDLRLNAVQSSPIWGNLGAETGGFEYWQEIKPTSGRGGWGWAQWTGPRRLAFEKFCRERGYQLDDHEANYQFLIHELQGSEKKSLDYLRRWTGGEEDVEPATKKFEQDFERAGVKNYAERVRYAKLAYDILKSQDVPRLAAWEIKALQQRLRDLGYVMVGKVDGIWGSSTTAAIAAFQHDNGLIVTGNVDEKTKALLSCEDCKPIAPERESTTVEDLKKQGSGTVINADKIDWVARITGVVSFLALVLGFIDEFLPAAQELMPSLEPFVNFLPPWLLPVIPFLVAVYLGFKAKAIKAERVEAERTGLHNGEATPAPIRPAEARAPVNPTVAGVIIDVITGGLLRRL